MQIVHVHVRVKPDSIEQLKEAAIENASKSIEEPGIARFDVVQDASDPARFILVEVYRYPEATAEHKETAHYKKWLRDNRCRNHVRVSSGAGGYVRGYRRPGGCLESVL